MLETRQGLEIHHLVPQETDVLQTTVNTAMCRFPLLGKDDVVLLDDVLDHVGGCHHFLSMFFGVSLNTTDLCCMGSPFYLSIIHL